MAMHSTSSSIVTVLTRTAAAVCTAAMCISLAACGGDDAKTSAGSQKLPQLTGVTAKGTPGKKPEISFKTPLSVENNATAVLQEGDGEALKNGDRLCLQLTQYSLKTGEEVATTWDSNVPDCSLVFNESDEPGSAESATLAQIANSTLKGKKINTTFGVGINDGSGDNQNYLLVATPVSQSKDLEKAEGKKVKDVPADLPKVTTATNGKPSIDMNGYKGSDKLVAQTLIEGNGPEITDDTYAAVVKYTGWLLDGKQFDSSWDRNDTFTATLNGGVIQGWTEGLRGKKVGSQVLLVVPPDLGYGDKEQGEIPANSTLVFVVDILAKY